MARKKRAVQVPSLSSSAASSAAESEDSSDDEDTTTTRHRCTCGCRRLVSDRTETRHWKNKAANASVTEQTKAAFRNVTPEPSFKGAKRATRRGGSLAPDPRPKKRAKSSADAAGGRAGDAAGEAPDSLAAADAGADSPDGAYASPVLQNEYESDAGEGAQDGSAGNGGSAPDGSPDELPTEDEDERPTLASYARFKYRATVSEELEGTDDEEHEGWSDSDETDDSDSDVLDQFSDDDNGISALESLSELFEQHIAALDAVDGISDEDLAALRAFSWQIERNITRETYKTMSDYFPEHKSSTYELDRAKMRRLSGVGPTLYDCCSNSCVLFVGRHASAKECPVCSTARYDELGRPASRFSYLPLIPRLKGMFRNKASSKRHLYRAQATKDHKDGEYCDVFDGKHYQGLRDKFVRIDGKKCTYKYFSDPRDVALGLFTDGFGPFKKRKSTCWPLLLVDYNLDPEERYKQENIISLGVIPGPKAPSDFNSFLYPLVQELLELAKGVAAFDGNKGEMFSMRAYLLLGCGDMPAVAKMTCMKGHNGLYSCRFCKIRGVRVPGARHPALYTPLDRACHPDAGEPVRYDPAELPLRTHEEMLRQALEVEESTGTRAQNLARDSGINGTPILAALPSIRLNVSFPVEFMHLVWLNLIPNLVRLYTGNFKDLGVGTGMYEFAAGVWETIGKLTAASGSTMPSAFGARVPNVAKDKTYMIAETWCIWTLHIAPVVLRGRFEHDRYYNHFMELVRLLRICLQLEITAADVQEIRVGFIKWVQKFEKYFYQYDPSRLSTCVSTVHGLLHIADSIETMGPVGCYWSFVMERYCSSLRPAIRSRRNPYANIDNRVIDRAMILQARLLNNLNARNRPFDEPTRPPVRASEFSISSYPVSVLMRPSKTVDLSLADRNRIARHLSVRFTANAKSLLALVPHRIETWGKVRRLDDGDTVHARGLVLWRPGRKDRDMSFVRYALEVDKFAHQRNKKPVFVRQEFYGQLQAVYVLSLPALPKYNQPTPQTLLLARVSPCNNTDKVPNSAGIRYYSGKLDPDTVIDLASIECVIGRVEDRNKVAIIDRSNELSRVIIPDDDEE